MHPRPLACAGAQIEFTEAEMTVSDKGAHIARLGERQRLSVVRLPGLSVELFGVGRDVAEQVECKRREPVLARKGFEDATTQPPCIVEPTQRETSAAQRIVGPAATADDVSRGQTI